MTLTPLNPSLEGALGAQCQGAEGHRWDSSPKIGFAPDSPLEEDGFEPLVPLARKLLILE
jgi:hypothetical protein